MRKGAAYKSKGLMGAILVLLLISVLASCAKEPDAKEGGEKEPAKEKSVSYYDMEFHRGGRDARPENTLYAYQYAIENGATTIECDMQMTADGQIVMSHNPALNPDMAKGPDGNRVVYGTCYIADMTLDELKAYNVGILDESSAYYEEHGRTQVMTDAEVPTLRELFGLVRDSGDGEIKLNIEAKTFADPAAGELYEKSPDKDHLIDEFTRLVEEFGFEDRVMLQAYDWKLLVKAKERMPEIETVALYREQPGVNSPNAETLWTGKDEPSPWLAGISIHDFDDDPLKAAHSLGIDAVSPFWQDVTPEYVEEAHGLGMKVIPWTLNTAEEMDAVYSMGADGMITDRPWVMREFLESKGETLRTARKVDLPYHLEPDHRDAE